MNEYPNDPNRPGGPLTPPPPPSSGTGQRASETIDDIAATLRDLFNRVPETVSRAVERAINVRDTTVLTRLSEEASDKIDTLVSSGISRNRTEAAAFLIEEGIKAQAALFQSIQSKMSEIERLRAELRTSVSPNLPK